MSDTIRKVLTKAPGFRDLQVPSGFQGGIGRTRAVDGNKVVTMRGADEDAVSGQAARYSALISSAEQAANNLREKFSGGKKNYTLSPEEEGQVLASFDDLAESIKLHQRDIDRGEPVVIASIADALMAADDNTRDMILRRAGYPAAFEPLRGATLGDIPDDASASRQAKVAEAAVELADEAKAEKAAESRSELPLVYRLSSHMNAPDYVGTRKPYNVQPGKDAWKRYRKADRPGQADGTADTSAMSESAKKQMLERLAGDQVAQVRAIEKKALLDSGLSEAEIKSLDPQRRGVLLGLLTESGEPTGSTGVVGLPAPGEIVPRGKNTLTIGTGERYGGGSVGKKNRSSDSVAMSSSRSPAQKMLEDMYRRTDSASRPAKGEKDSSLLPTGGSAFGDLSHYMDKNFPWWRGRFADSVGPDGNLVYPARLPTPEFITGMIQSMYGVSDQAFYDRMLPLITEAISQAPDTPVGSKAIEMSQIVHLPSGQWLKVLEGGVGSPDYPTSIYGDRAVPRDAVEAPERHPFGKGAIGKPLPPKPGSGDSASISRMPANSPMRLLLA